MDYYAPLKGTQGELNSKSTDLLLSSQVFQEQNVCQEQDSAEQYWFLKIHTLSKPNNSLPELREMWELHLFSVNLSNWGTLNCLEVSADSVGIRSEGLDPQLEFI